MKAPSVIDGVRMSVEQQRRLQDIVDAISKVNPGKSKERVLKQAIGSFQKTASLRQGRWVDRAKFNLNNGNGPVVIPSWSPLLDG
tara:strand:- start:254 stop:508 length:255 start_codon:yes stop_codon:yes gene_type:complete